jgi:hypothetical protein
MKRMLLCCRTLTLLAALTIALPTAAFSAEVQKAEMTGYLLVSSDKVPDAYNAGFSLYAAAYAGGMLGVWQGQVKVVNTVPHTGLAVSNDSYDGTTNGGFKERPDKVAGWLLGGGGNPHPSGKRRVAARLADIALVKTYGQPGLPSALHLTRSASVTRESNNILQVLIDSPDIQVKCTTGPRPTSHSAIAGVPSSKLVATASMGPVTTLRTPAAWKGPSFPVPLPTSLSARVSVRSMPQFVGTPVRDHEAGFLRLLHAVFYRAAIGICIVPFALRPLRLPVLPASLLGFLLPLQFAG